MGNKKGGGGGRSGAGTGRSAKNLRAQHEREYDRLKGMIDSRKPKSIIRDQKQFLQEIADELIRWGG